MRSGDWSKWSAIAEIFGAIAILITLVYLSTQTRYLALQTEQNTAAIQASVRQEMLATELEILSREIEYPLLASVGRDEREPTRSELTQLNAYLLSLLRVRESQWLQYQNGAIDERTWLAYRAAIPLMFNQEIRRQWWRQRAQLNAVTREFDPEFVGLVDELIPAPAQR